MADTAVGVLLRSEGWDGSCGDCNDDSDVWFEIDVPGVVPDGDGVAFGEVNWTRRRLDELAIVGEATAPAIFIFSSCCESCEGVKLLLWSATTSAQVVETDNLRL